MVDGDRLRNTTWVCELCAHSVIERRAEGDDPERCEKCQYPHLRGFASGDPEAEAFADEIYRRNHAIEEVPELSGRGRSNRPHRDEIATLVVCEDDEITLDLLCEHLSADRFAVLRAANAAEGLRLCRCNPDLLLLDLTLPDASGLDVLREIREADGVTLDPRLPVIVLSAAGGGRDHSRALDSGADDYVVKPFRYPELRARIGAALRRRSGPETALLSIGGLVIDLTRRRVTVGGRAVAVGQREFDLLHVLATDPTRCFSHEELAVAVWRGRSASRRRTVDSHACRLRHKLDPEHKRFVVNCWGIGYRLTSD